MKNHEKQASNEPQCDDASPTPFYGRRAKMTVVGRLTMPAFRNRGGAPFYRGTTYGHRNGGR